VFPGEVDRENAEEIMTEFVLYKGRGKELITSGLRWM